LNLSYFISKRINRKNTTGFSAAIHNIAVVSIGIGLAAAILSFLVMTGFQDTVKNKIFGFSGHLLITKYSDNNSTEESPINYHIDVYDHVKEYPFVSHIQEFAHKPGLVKTQNEVLGVVVKGVGKSFDQNAFASSMIEGRFINFPDSAYANEVVISRTIADKVDAKVNDAIIVHFFQNPPRLRKLKITGIYETNLSEYFDTKVIICDIRMIQQLNDWSDSIAGGLEVFLNFDKSIPMNTEPEVVSFEEFDEDIYGEPKKGFFGKFFEFDNAAIRINQSKEDIALRMDFDLNVERVSDRYIHVFDWLKLLSRQVRILLIIILTVISLNMISIILILVMERTQMIGLLKALGAGNHLIRSVFIFNGISLILKGLVLGNILGLGLCYLQDKFQIIKLNPHDYYMSFVPVSWNWEIVIFLNLLTFVVVTLVLLVPTMIISGVNPIRAMRFD
jgi:lipoprotein-releasing system permease protein